MFNNKIIINSKKIKTILFDFDGVILDSVDIKTNAFRELFKQQPKSILDKIIHHHQINGGISRYEKIKYYYENFIKKEIDEKKYNLLLNDFSSIVFDKVINAKFIDGSLVYIKKNFEKFNMFIISATPEAELIKIVKIKKIDHYFKGIFGSPSKKEDNIQKVIRKYSFLKNEVLFVGDSINDFEAARKNKISFISV